VVEKDFRCGLISLPLRLVRPPSFTLRHSSAPHLFLVPFLTLLFPLSLPSSASSQRAPSVLVLHTSRHSCLQSRPAITGRECSSLHCPVSSSLYWLIFQIPHPLRTKSLGRYLIVHHGYTSLSPQSTLFWPVAT